MHLIRNSMDHGIESPEARAEGEAGTAVIHLAARHSGASVPELRSRDDGGINAEAVSLQGNRARPYAENAQLSDQEIFSFIFQPGFSTAKQVTDG